ncbi:MAG: hypothetical protein ACREXR_14120, partial [Gammaproteobacteria bacterium]
PTGNVGYGRGYTGTYSGNAETDKPLPKVARVAFLSQPAQERLGMRFEDTRPNREFVNTSNGGRYA